MFSEDKFNELVKNLKEGKDVPTPKPEPIRRQKKQNKPQQQPAIQPSRVNDIGGWLAQVDDLKSEMNRLKSENNRLTEANTQLIENRSKLESQLTESSSVGELRSEASLLNEKLRSAHQHHSKLESQIKKLNEERESQSLEIHRLNQSHTSLSQSLAKLTKSSKTVDWKAVFEERGLSSQDEMKTAFQVLVGSERFLNQLFSTNPNLEEIFQILETELCLSAISKEILPISMVANVAPEYCEIDGGHSVAQAVRQFIDALLIYGHSKVVFVGANPKDVTLMRHFVNHHAIDILCVQEPENFDLESMMQDFSDKNIIVHWVLARNQESRILKRLHQNGRYAYSVVASSLFGLLATAGDQLMDEHK